LGKTQEAIEFWVKAKKQKDYSKLLDKKLQNGKLYE
jgi:hypothetical protein